MGSRGGLWGLVAAGVALTTLAVPELLVEAYPFIIAIFFIIMLFRFGAFGQGDAVLAVWTSGDCLQRWALDAPGAAGN